MTAVTTNLRTGRRRVVVTGLGAITPLGLTVPTFWENAINGVSGAAPITHFDASAFSTRFACEVKGFDAHNHMDRKAAKRMDPTPRRFLRRRTSPSAFPEQPFR